MLTLYKYIKHTTMHTERYIKLLFINMSFVSALGLEVYGNHNRLSLKDP